MSRSDAQVETLRARRYHFDEVIADYKRVTGTTNIATAPAFLAEQYVDALAAQLAKTGRYVRALERFLARNLGNGAVDQVRRTLAAQEGDTPDGN